MRSEDHDLLPMLAHTGAEDMMDYIDAGHRGVKSMQISVLGQMGVWEGIGQVGYDGAEQVGIDGS